MILKIDITFNQLGRLHIALDAEENYYERGASCGMVRSPFVKIMDVKPVQDERLKDRDAVPMYSVTLQVLENRSESLSSRGGMRSGGTLVELAKLTRVLDALDLYPDVGRKPTVGPAMNLEAHG